jgi:hypothetical protein
MANWDDQNNRLSESIFHQRYLFFIIDHSPKKEAKVHVSQEH